MESIGRQHVATRAYLNQLLLDIEQSDVGAYFNLPNIKRYGCCNHGIPLLVRTAVSRYTKNGGRPLVPRMMPMGGGGRIIPEGASGGGGGGGCPLGVTVAQACGGNLNENGGGAAAAGVGPPPPESELGACSGGGIQCPSKQTGNDTVTSDDGSGGPGMAPETNKRRRVHYEEPSFIERIDLSDLFKFGSSALPSNSQHQYNHHQPTTAAASSPNLLTTTGNSDEFNDGWGPGPATVMMGPPHLMARPGNQTSRPPVVHNPLPHRTMNNNPSTSTTGMFANNNNNNNIIVGDGTGGLGPSSSMSDFDVDANNQQYIIPLPLEDIANMDSMFSDITGMDGMDGMDGMNGIIDLDLDLTNVLLVDPTMFLSTGT